MRDRRWQIVGCEPCHLRQLARTLRADDAEEVRALGQPSPMRMMYRTWRASVVRRTAFVDGEIAAAWGLIGGGSLMAATGVPWLLTAPAIERVPLDFAREARREVREMLDIYPLLENWVHAPYRRAVGFLKIVGFTIDEAQPILPTGEYFHRFWMSRSS